MECAGSFLAAHVLILTALREQDMCHKNQHVCCKNQHVWECVMALAAYAVIAFGFTESEGVEDLIASARVREEEGILVRWMGWACSTIVAISDCRGK